MADGGENFFSNAPQTTGNDAVLRGEIDHVVYDSGDASSPFCVFKLNDEQGVMHCAVARSSGLFPGQSVTLMGKWEFHKDYGRRLVADKVETTLPVTKSGIVKYLSSGIIKGIGKKYAEAIVAAFGTNTLNVLDTASRRLKEVPGLGKKRIEAIREAWQKNKSQRDLQIFMQSMGITPAYAKKIYALYGDKASDVIRSDPYKIASDVKGIGFILADRIAVNAGFAANDVRRLTAGVTYALNQARTSGHTAVPEKVFIPMLSKLLGVEEDDAKKALASAVELHTAALEQGSDDVLYVYDPALLRCECELPRMIVSLLRVRNHAGLRLASVPPLINSMLSGEQLNAVIQASKSPVSIITGGPGVGKTTVISEIVRRARKAKLEVVLAAPTGRAAKRMSETSGENAMTLHRLLKWDPESGQFVHNRKNTLSGNLFIVDETSMLDLPLALAFFRAVAPGACVVIVGDPDQLPSVGPGNVLNDLIKSGICPVSRLTKIFRQGAGSGIITSAHDVNNGVMPRVSGRARTSPDGAIRDDFFWIDREDPVETANLIETLVSDRIPRRFGFHPIKDVQLLCPMNRGDTGTIAMNARLQAILNPAGKTKSEFHSGERIFRLGDKVMQTSNNYDKGVFNGDMGFIKSIDLPDGSFTVAFEDEKIIYNFDEADQIVHAYAVTVHKSQGSEFPAVVMPLLTQNYMLLQRNLLYTAITRAKRLMVLVGSKRAVATAVKNTVKEPRYSLLFERLRSISL